MNYIDVFKMMKEAAEAAPVAKPVPIYNYHTIAPGSTLGGIAKQYKTTVDHLAKVNKIPDVNKIQANKKILVPTGQFLGQQPAKFDVNTPLDDTVANNVADVLWTMESGRGKWLSNKNSTASGHFHWLNGTWQDFQKKYPKETTGMTKANLDDYETALKFQKMKLADDALRYQKATGKQVTDKDLYAIHYGGFGGRNSQGALDYAAKVTNPKYYTDRKLPVPASLLPPPAKK